MYKKIEYRWETKEEQEQHWKEGDEDINYTYKRKKEYYNSIGEELYAETDCEMVVYSRYISMRNYVLHNEIDWAIEEAKLGLDIVEKNIDRIDDPIGLMEYRAKLYFILDKKLHDKYLEQYVLRVNEEYNVSSLNKQECVSCALCNLQCGNFGIAREYIKKIYKITPRNKLNNNIVYHLDKFCAYIIEYLCDLEKDTDMTNKLTECFRFLFNEEQKGSKKLYSERTLQLYKKDNVIALRYIWYKYFSGRDWETISPIEVIQSERYGVKGLQDC